MAAPAHQSLDVVVVVRELANGDRVAFPAAAPDLVSYGSESSCLEDPAHYGLGESFREQGRVEEAIKQYRKALRINPGFVVAHVNLGILLVS